VSSRGASMPETRADQGRAPRPRGVPGNAVRVVLPHSEVCMHMRLAGKTRWAAPVGEHMAQIYSDDGSRFSAPVTLGEAGLNDQGQPMGSPPAV
jgi:hypothetical protein